MSKTRVLIQFCFLFYFNFSLAQRSTVPIGTSSSNEEQGVSIELAHRYQHYNAHPTNKSDIYDQSINSPKSVIILDAKKKFYVNSLEGSTTSVYSLESFALIKTIKHVFNETNQKLFSNDPYFDYKYTSNTTNVNYFKGKPVEGCFSHNGKYLWVTYYRRSYDVNAIDISAVCIIDTETDSIVRVMPTAPLPKMITCSPNNKTIAVTHWGDNTVALIDISSNDPKKFAYTKNIVIDYKLSLKFDSSEKVNRDLDCGNCLRGSIFTPNNKYLLIGKMGGNGIAIVDIDNKKYLGTVTGMKTNMRHLVIKDSMLYISINKTGFVQKTSLNKFISHFTSKEKDKSYKDWKSIYVGEGARTIVTDKTGKYLFAAINNKSSVAIVRTSDMKLIASCKADSYPVGMDISEDGKWLIVTAQGRETGGGNSVMVFKVKYDK